MSTTRRRLAANGALFVLAISGCSDSDPLDSVSGATQVSATNVSSGGSNGSNGSNGTATQEGTTEGDSEGGTDTASTEPEPTTGEPAPTREACDQYLDCLAVVSPAELPAAQTGFGPDGTCWDGPPESIEQCIQACVSGLESLHASNPGEPACYLCAGDEDCGPGETCSAGECRLASCGDGIVDPDEVCDGQDACEPDCSAQGCNPLSGAGCDGGDACFVLETIPKCLPPPNDLPGLFEPCEFETFPGCVTGLLCVPAYAVPGGCDPDAAENCCTPLCDGSQETSDCPGDLLCELDFGIQPPFEEYVGVCVLF